MNKLLMSFLFLFAWIQIGCNKKAIVIESPKQQASEITQGLGSEVSAFGRGNFIGTDFAWLTKLDGGLLRTQNGGVSWESVSTEFAGKFLSLSFIDEKNGWALDEESGIWRTEDSGQTWVQISKLILQNDIYLQHHIQFVDSLHGWVIDPFSVWRSVDGGNTWKQTLVESFLGETHSVFEGYFISPNVGWLLGHRGELLQTQDGGESWQIKKASSDERRITSIFFLDDNQGWIATDSVAETISGEPIKGIYFSSDSGSTWQLQKALNENTNIESIYFTGLDVGWAVGSELIKGKTTPYDHRGIILHTIDKGQSWQSVSVNLEERYLYKIYFADTMQGWLSANRGLYRTNDGGKTWHTMLNIPTIYIKD